MPRRFLSHWRGILLSLIGIVSTLWLALTGQLGLYIHPRYFVFTTVMAGIAAVLVLLAFAFVPGAEADEHEADADADDNDEHEHTDDEAPPRGRRWWIVGNTIAIIGCAIALLVLPPATLATSALEQRDINGSVGQAGDAASIELVGGDSSTFTVKDWAVLLRQGVDASFLAQENPTIVGFVTPDPDDPENVFYVARFVVTCCAVDAQPVGVPVFEPGWQQSLNTDEWVSVAGSFVSNPSATSAHAIVVKPVEITPVDAPAEPYVY